MKISYLWFGLIFFLLPISPLPGETHRIPPQPFKVEVVREDDRAVANVRIEVGGRFAYSNAGGEVVFEGLPAGSYGLRALHWNYERLEQEINVPAGAREPVRIVLPQTQTFTTEGRILSEQGDFPLVGAKVTLQPLDVPAFTQGTFMGRSDRTGTFRFLEVPSGLYRVEVEAAEHDALVEEWHIEEGQAQNDLRLIPHTRSARVSVRVVSANDNAPLAGARVAVAEAWPRGVSAFGETGATGVFEARDILVGYTNRETLTNDFPDGWDRSGLSRFSTVLMTSPQVMLYVEKDGYQPNVKSFYLDASNNLTIRLRPLVLPDPPASSRNHSLGSATEVAVGSQFHVDLREERQAWFRFRVEHPTFLEVRTLGAAPVRNTMRLIGSGGQEIASSWNFVNRTNRLAPRWLSPGDYFLHIEGTETVDTSFGLEISGPPVLHADGEHRDRENARSIFSGRQYRGYLADYPQENYYRFRMERRGEVHFSLPASELRRSLEILRPNGYTEASTWGFSNRDIRLSHDLEPGDYFVRVSAISSQGSRDPYSLYFHSIMDDGVNELTSVSGQILTPRTLESNGKVGGFLFPRGDRDFYRLAIPSGGRLQLRSQAPYSHNFRLYSFDGEILAETWNFPHRRASINFDFNGPTSVFVEIAPRSETVAAHSYVIESQFQTEDELNLLAGHQTLRRALPIQLGQTIRGTLFPNEDEDWYSLQIDHPGKLTVTTLGPVGSNLTLFDDRGEMVESQWHFSHRTATITRDMLPGNYYLQVSPRGNVSSLYSYELNTSLERAEPAETVPLDRDPVRRLTLNVAQTWQPDQVGDVDRFVFDVTEAGDYYFYGDCPVGWELRVRDARTGEMLLDRWAFSNRNIRHQFSFEGPTRLVIELRGRGNSSTLSPGYILISSEQINPPSAQLQVNVQVEEPTLVNFETSRPQGGFVSAEIDPGDGSGNILTVGQDQRVSYRYPREGLYVANVLFRGEGGVDTQTQLWVDAIGAPELSGISVFVDYPYEGQMVFSPEDARVRALSFSGHDLHRVETRLNGQALPTAFSRPFTFPIPWANLVDGRDHRLEVTAFDRSGESVGVERTFRVSGYLDLQPEDGAVLTGNQVTVSWRSGAFRETRVRYRPVGSDQWQEARGESGRWHVVRLTDLEPEVAYEFQPLGGAEAGPVRTVTRVRGLAFGQMVYGPTIERDYDQRFPITIRNHADEEMTVRLEAGHPGDEELLVGFVEEGATERPFVLGAGEERAFILSLNAQDAMREDYVFPVRIRSDSGFSDEAEVQVTVRLPEVAFAFESVGVMDEGLGERIRITNEGDSLTDFSLQYEGDRISISPMITHGYFPAGQSMEFNLRPALFDGFQLASGVLQASAVATVIEHPYRLEVPEGQTLYRVNLAPEADAERLAPGDQTLLEARALAASLLNPAYIRPENWQVSPAPQGAGVGAEWVFIDELERIFWVGRDTNGDREIDYVKADVGFDGQFDYAAMRIDGQWRRTNILGITLETSFTHPRDRASYDPYDVELSLNRQPIGGLEQTLPEGNYRFQIPPNALNFDAHGWPGNDQLEMRSRGMGRGSYGMQSDLQVQVRLAPTPMWAVASSRDEAEETIRQTEGLVLHHPDFSVSAADKRLILGSSPQAGDMAELIIPVANIGAGIGEMVEVALSRSEHRGADLEIQRLVIEEIRPGSRESVRFVWPLSAGRHRYRVQVDPRGHSGDVFTSNNNAYFWVEAEGDLEEGSAPQIRILTPAPETRLASAATSLEVEAQGDLGLSRVEVRIGSGTLWQPLVWQGEDLFTTDLLLPAGDHSITVRATDGTGRSHSETLNVTVEGTDPVVEILNPAAGVTLDSRQVLVRASVENGIVMAGARVNNGPWQPLRLGEGVVFAPVNLRFGDNLIEVKVVSPEGWEGLASVRVRCLEDAREEPPEEETEEPALDGESTPSPQEIEVPGFGSRRLSDDGPRARRPAEGQQTQPPGVPPVFFDEQDLEERMAGEDWDSLPDLNIPADILAEWEQWENLPEEEWNPTEEVETYDGSGFVWDPANLEDATEEELEALMADFLRDYLNDVGLQMDPDYWHELFGEDPDTSDSVDYHGMSLPSSGLSGRPPAGRSVSIQHTQKTRHCTNRPVIGMRFEMPEWLQMLDLPEPGTEEFQAAIDRLLTQMRMEGYQMNAFEDLHRILRNRAMRMESPEELPSFLQSVLPYFTSPPDRDEAGLQEWREGMAKKVDAFWLRLLSSGDPALIYQGLRARADAFQKFDEGAMQAAHAAMDEVQRHQNNMETVISAVPIMGDVFDVIAIYQGETLAGEEMTAGRIAMMAGMRVAFLGGPRAARALYSRAMKTQNGRMFFAAMREMGGNFSSGSVNFMARVSGSTPAGVRDFFTRQRSLQGGIDWMLGRKTQAAGRNFVPFRAGQEAYYRQRIDQRHAENFLDRMSRTTDPEEFRRMAIQLQRNKTAQAMINTPGYSNELRRRADLARRKLAASADRQTIRQIQAMTPEESGLDRVLRHNRGLTADNVQVRSRTITGHRARDGHFSYGRDRDVWFEFVDKRTGRRLGDVHHDVSGRVYNDHIRNMTGYSATDLDHTVTSWWHPDTYGTGVLDPAGHERAARRIVDGASAGHLRRAQDVADTTRYKPREWFNPPHDAAGNPIRISPVEQQRRMREGFRQSMKEYNRHVRPYLEANGLSPNDLPPRLREGLRIFEDTQPLTGPRSLSPRDVNQFAIFRDTGGTAMEALDAAIPPEQATRMLESLGTTPEGIVDDLADYIQFINLFGHGN